MKGKDFHFAQTAFALNSRPPLGFTIVEVMVAVAIMGIVAAGLSRLMLTLQQAQEDSREAGQAEAMLSRFFEQQTSGRVLNVNLIDPVWDAHIAGVMACPAGNIDFISPTEQVCSPPSNVGPPKVRVLFRTYCSDWDGSVAAGSAEFRKGWWKAPPPASAINPFKRCTQTCWPGQQPRTSVVIERDGVETQRINIWGATTCSNGTNTDVAGLGIGNVVLNMEMINRDRTKTHVTEYPFPIFAQMQMIKGAAINFPQCPNTVANFFARYQDNPGVNMLRGTCG